MGRGRHKSSRGQDSGSEWVGEHGGSGWDDERGTQEWLNDVDGPGWLDDAGPPDAAGPTPFEPFKSAHQPADPARTPGAFGPPGGGTGGFDLPDGGTGAFDPPRAGVGGGTSPEAAPGAFGTPGGRAGSFGQPGGDMRSFGPPEGGPGSFGSPTGGAGSFGSPEGGPGLFGPPAGGVTGSFDPPGAGAEGFGPSGSARGAFEAPRGAQEGFGASTGARGAFEPSGGSPGAFEPLRDGREIQEPSLPGPSEPGQAGLGQPAWPNAWDDASAGRSDRLSSLGVTGSPGPMPADPLPAWKSGSTVTDRPTGWDTGWNAGPTSGGGEGQSGRPGQTAFLHSSEPGATYASASPEPDPRPGHTAAPFGAETPEEASTGLLPAVEHGAEGMAAFQQAGPAVREGATGVPGPGLDRENGFLPPDTRPDRDGGFPGSQSDRNGAFPEPGPGLDREGGFPAPDPDLDSEVGFLGPDPTLDREGGFLRPGPESEGDQESGFADRKSRFAVPAKGADRDEFDALRSGPDKGRRKQRPAGAGFWRGRRLMALSALAVVTAIGTAVIGVKLSSTDLDLTRSPDCPPGQACAAVAKPSADPIVSDPAGSTGPPGDGSPSPRASKSAKPSPNASPTPARRTPVASAQPTPERTRATPTPKASRSASPEPEPTPTEEDTEITESPEATPTDEVKDPVISPGRVSVDFGVAGITGTGYTGRLTVANRGVTLDGWNVRIPVGGTVTGVDGSDWTQEGDILVLGSTEPLAQNDEVVVSFVAEGDATPPSTCELNGGTCRIRVSETALLNL